MDGALGEFDSALRSDIPRLGAHLRDALVRQHGPELLEQVEQVRSLAPCLRRRDEDSTALAGLPARMDVAHAGRLAWPSPSTSIWPTRSSRCNGVVAGMRNTG